MANSNNKLSWEFLLKDKIYLRIEKAFLTLLTLFVFFFTFYQLKNLFTSILITISFLIIHFIITLIIQKTRQVEEKYDLTTTHFQITRKTNKKIKKEKIPLKEISHHKLDKIFLGGYIITYKGKKHLLFFNNKQESEQFEKFIKNHSKPIAKKK